jgi:chromosome segregation protein
MVGHLFPGGRGRLRLVHPDGPRPVGSADGDDSEVASAAGAGAAGQAGQGATASREAGEQATVAAAQSQESDVDEEEPGQSEPGVEVEVTPAGKSMKRLSLLSGGEKSLVALAFLFAVFLAKPCPFYVLDEVEAALDDVNIDRFLQLVRRFSDRAQFIVVTHQKRTMDAADCLYGVSMGGDGVSKVISRRLPPDAASGIDSAGEAAPGSSEAAA